MQRKLLDKRFSFQFSLSVWQIILLAEMVILLLYVCWEIYWLSKVGTAAIKWHTYFAGFVFGISLLLLLPYAWVHYIKQRSWLLVLYVPLCLLIGEAHPFSNVSMYSSFAPDAYAFMLTDNRDNIIPISKYYSTHSGNLGHEFNSICADMHINGYPDYAKAENVIAIGKVLFAHLQLKEISTPPTDSVKLYMVSYTYGGNKISSNKTLMYNGSVGK